MARAAIFFFLPMFSRLSRRSLSTTASSFRPLATATATGDGAGSGPSPKFFIVDTTLREGEQFATTEFTRQDRVYIAHVLDKVSVTALAPPPPPPFPFLC